jgi:hypothetical protein
MAVRKGGKLVLTDCTWFKGEEVKSVSCFRCLGMSATVTHITENLRLLSLEVAWGCLLQIQTYCLQRIGNL